MITPDLKEVFFEHDFSDDSIPETKDTERELEDVLTKLETAYCLAHDDYCEIESASFGFAVMSQYLGFLQGFKWAVYLFTGHKESEEAGR